MKLKLIFFICLSFFLESLPQAQAIVQDQQESSQNMSVHPHTFEPINDIIHDSLLELFFTQPEYTRSSFKYFLTNIFNNNKYATQFLSFNFSHISTFLNYTKQSEVPRDYLCRVLGLFAQKLKSTHYVNGHCFEEFLGSLAITLQPFFKKETDEKNQIETIRHCIYNYLLRDFNTLKENPDFALDELSLQIYNALDSKKLDSDITIAKLQQDLLIFLEITLNKLIWASIDQEQIWTSVKNIGQHLEQLRIVNAIESDDQLNALYWSVISRFCYFLELSGNELNTDFYALVLQDLNNFSQSLWMLKERESYITTKLETLKFSLMQAEIKARAYQAGMIADTIAQAA